MFTGPVVQSTSTTEEAVHTKTRNVYEVNKVNLDFMLMMQCKSYRSSFIMLLKIKVPKAGFHINRIKEPCLVPQRTIQLTVQV